MAHILSCRLPVHEACLHIANRGGTHEGIRWVGAYRKQHRYVYRSDIKGYYRHIRHGQVLKQLKQHINDRKLLHLIRRYLHRTETYGGLYCEKHQGLNKGDPLAPFIGALYLQALDRALSKLGPYRRFMDDWIIFCDDKKTLRRIDQTTRRVLKKLGLRMHPDKTDIGRCWRGFDFLGIHFDACHLSIPWQRLLRIKNKAAAKRNAKGRMAYLSAVNRYYTSLEATSQETISREWPDDALLYGWPANAYCLPVECRSC